MTFWIAILVGLVVAFIASRRGLYEAVVLGFNLNLSIYLALFLTPTLISNIPTAVDIPGGLSLTILLVFAICFGALCVVSFFLFTGQFSVPLAKVLDLLGGATVGAWTGFLGGSFLIVILTLTPIPGAPQWVQALEVTPNTQVLCSACDTTHRAIGADKTYKTAALLVWLDEKAQEIQRPKSIDPNTDPNGPTEEKPRLKK